MKRIIGFTAIAALLGFAGFSMPVNASVSDGKALYQANCAACHGANATGNIGPNITGKNGKDIAKAINSVPMMISLKSSITKSDAAAIGKYLGSLAGGKIKKKENKAAAMKKTSYIILKTEKAAIAMGRKLFKDTSLGTNGKSCDLCHTNMGRSGKKGPMGAMNFINSKPYPHYFMAGRAMSLDQTINFCVQMALKGKPFAWDDPRLTALNAYISSIHR